MWSSLRIGNMATCPRFLFGETNIFVGWFVSSSSLILVSVLKKHFPASSKWPFDSPNGGHLTPEKVTNKTPKRVTTGRTWFCSFAQQGSKSSSCLHFDENDWSWSHLPEFGMGLHNFHVIRTRERHDDNDWKIEKKPHLANGPWTKKVWTLFSLLNCHGIPKSSKPVSLLG